MKTILSNHRCVSITAVLMLLVCFASEGQFYDCSSGLLQAPTAEMNPSGTFMITNNLLNKHAISPRWGYNTFGYGINITMFSRVEIGYVMTIMDDKRKENPTEIQKIRFNQDRHFYGKIQLLKEGEFSKDWIPALAIGISDPVTGSGAGEYIGSDITGGAGNGFFNRYYVVATKHFSTPYGPIGAHMGYQYNKRQDIHYNGPCAAIDWMPVWLQKENVVRTKLIAEYDARTFNIGAIISLWKDHFDVMLDLQALKWLSAGIRYKLVLKS